MTTAPVVIDLQKPFIADRDEGYPWANPDAPARRPEIAGVIRAAYDPVLPAVATDASHALRLAARLR